ncbi:MAG: aminotransferase class I/II-fold pyridoxal phosphate-dependent enzyme [Armatimonadota bacterium]
MTRPTPKTATLAVHAGHAADLAHGAVAAPIYQTTSFAFGSAEQGARRFAREEDGYIYTRYGNPTTRVFEEKLAALEGAEAAQGVASGMAAVTTALLTLLEAGDHIVASESIYSAVHVLLSETLPPLGIECTFVDATEAGRVAEAVKPNTRVIYFETPGNPTLKLVDIAAVTAIARGAGVTTVADNTFATPVNQRPMELGVDVVIHSATKYLGGHGDLIGGAVVGSGAFMDEVWHKHIQLGGALSPLNSFLIARGMQTLPLRMAAHNENALRIAGFLEQHAAVERVMYPGLPSHPQHELARSQMSGYGGMVCFELEGGVQAGRRLMNSVELCTLAVSLGDVKTLICHPASMTHSDVPPAAREKTGVTDGLVRLSVGIEDADDLMGDLDRALAQAGD